MERDEVGFRAAIGRAALARLRAASRRPQPFAAARNRERASKSRARGRHRLADAAAAADEADGFAVNAGNRASSSTASREIPRPYQAIAFDDAARHREQQGDMHVGGRLVGERRHDRHRNAPLGRCLDIDVVGVIAIEVTASSPALAVITSRIDLVVQEAEQDIAGAHRGDQRVLADDCGARRVDRDVGYPAQALRARSRRSAG